ncbi:DUF6494 family protein [Methylocapsa palsarum]
MRRCSTSFKALLRNRRSAKAQSSLRQSCFGRIPRGEDRFDMTERWFLKVVGATSQREIERIVRDGKRAASGFVPTRSHLF